MTLLTQISDEKAGDGRVIIDDQKLRGIAGNRLHVIISIKHYPCQPNRSAKLQARNRNQFPKGGCARSLEIEVWESLWSLRTLDLQFRFCYSPSFLSILL